MADVTWPIVAGTGHRELDAGATAWCREKIPAAARWLRDECGTRIIISGMARGFDLMWAAAALDAGLELWAYIPFKEQADKWNRADKAEWWRLRFRAKVTILGEIDPELPSKRRSSAVNALLFARNDAMLRDADAVLAVWDATRRTGGTYGAIKKAGALRLSGVHLDPVARTFAWKLQPRRERAA